MLGYLDSNQEQKNQNLPCCQLHHTPPSLTEAGPTSNSNLPRNGRQNGRAVRVLPDKNGRIQGEHS
ncbi:MAG: hypothetical protein JWP05_761 [Microbacteriaceae bacterium]|nr:hypothetical protein [Microbacteriaceae bacterium]